MAEPIQSPLLSPHFPLGLPVLAPTLAPVPLLQAAVHSWNLASCLVLDHFPVAFLRQKPKPSWFLFYVALLNSPFLCCAQPVLNSDRPSHFFQFLHLTRSACIHSGFQTLFIRPFAREVSHL